MSGVGLLVGPHRPHLQLILDALHAGHAPCRARGLNLLNEASNRTAEDHGAVDRLYGDLIRVDAPVVGQRPHDGVLKAVV